MGPGRGQRKSEDTSLNICEMIWIRIPINFAGCQGIGQTVTVLLIVLGPGQSKSGQKIGRVSLQREREREVDVSAKAVLTWHRDSNLEHCRH